MTNLQNFQPSTEKLEMFRMAYIRAMCNAAVVSGVQPPTTVSGASTSRNELLQNLENLKNVYEEGGLSGNDWAQKAYTEIEKRIKPLADYNAETVGDALRDYCQAFFNFGIQKFSVPKNTNPFA
jgi:hypothetical protein